MRCYRRMLLSCVIAGSVLMAASAVAEPTPACADVADHGERLACFDRLTGCATLSDDAQRLRCYEARSQAPRVAKPATSTSPPAVSAPATDPEDSAGPSTVDAAPVQAAPALPAADEPFPVRGARESKPQSEQRLLRSRVTAVVLDHRGRARLTLANGQVWQVLAEARFEFDAGTDVEIRAGILGSTNLTANGMGGYVKVRRLR